MVDTENVQVTDEDRDTVWGIVEAAQVSGQVLPGDTAEWLALEFARLRAEARAVGYAEGVTAGREQMGDSLRAWLASEGMSD